MVENCFHVQYWYSPVADDIGNLVVCNRTVIHINIYKCICIHTHISTYVYISAQGMRYQKWNPQISNEIGCDDNEVNISRMELRLIFMRLIHISIMGRKIYNEVNISTIGSRYLSKKVSKCIYPRWGRYILLSMRSTWEIRSIYP